MTTQSPPKRPGWQYRRIPFPVWLIIIGFVGGLFGLGGYTFLHAQGTSYLSDDAQACTNCHIMGDVYKAWSVGGHKTVAACNDCHVPHSSLVEKYAIKAIDGVKHSIAFTTGNFDEPIRISQLSHDVAQENCLYCHGTLTTLINHENSQEPTDCLRCHATVGHEP